MGIYHPGLAFLGLAVFNLIRVELPYYLRTLGMESGFWIGGVLSTGALTGAIASLGYERVRAWVGYRSTIALLFGLFAVGFGVISAASFPAVVSIGLLLAGGGMGLFVPALNDGVGEAAPQSLRGRLMGGLGAVRNLGRFASPLLTYPGLVGAGTTAPFLGGTVLAGGLALGALVWATAQSVPKKTASRAPSALAEKSRSTARC